MAWSPLQELVTLEQARNHLKLPDVGSPDPTADDDELTLQIAHEHVLDYLAQRADTDETTNQADWQDVMDAWTADTAPKRVIGAILAEFAFLYRFRGDDEAKAPIPDGDGVCPMAKRLLSRFRDPAFS